MVKYSDVEVKNVLAVPKNMDNKTNIVFQKNGVIRVQNKRKKRRK